MTIVAISRTLKVMLDMTVPSLGTLAATRPVSVRNQAPRRWDLHGFGMCRSLRILLAVRVAPLLSLRGASRHRERLPSGPGKPSRNFAELEYLGMDRCSGSLYQPSRAWCRMSMFPLNNLLSLVPHGGIGNDIGVITCTLCGQQCKGHRGLQAHLRACTKRRPERMSAVSYTHLTLPTKRIV